ncbi:ECF-type sigma factor [Mariniblastus sp.]|nr:ECF-type sigma factor [Mariniblastus sp.]MDC3255918.1 ECF-type sigma factor [bacterium]
MEKFKIIDDPVTIWIEQVRQSDDEAIKRVWQHFADGLQEYARGKIHPKTRRVYDEQDAVQSMFLSLCQGLKADRYPDLQNRDNLWRLMLVMTGRKISKRHRFDRQLKRDNRRLLTDSYFVQNSQDRNSPNQYPPAAEPTPELLAEFADTSSALIEALGTDNLKDVALLRIEGLDDCEIASRLQCSRSTVQRRLVMIRKIWEVELFND